MKLRGKINIEFYKNYAVIQGVNDRKIKEQNKKKHVVLDCIFREDW